MVMPSKVDFISITIFQ